MRYVIVGAGAIGGTVGAYMIRAGHDVLFVDTAADHVQAINEQGLTVRGYGGEFTVRAKAITPDELKGPLEAVLLATKAQHTEAALASFQSLLAPDGFVVSLQNGLNEIVISRMIGAERTVGCFVNFSADYIEPGVIHYGGPGAFYIGELDGSLTPRLQALQQALSAWGPVETTGDIFGYLWGKQGYGAMLFATSLTNETMGECIDRHRELMVAIAREVLSVAEKLGVKARGFNGYDPEIYLSGDWDAIHASLDRLVAIRAQDEKKHAGIWRDIAVRKRRTEVDHQPGMVLAEGERLGLTLPLLKALVRMIHELEEGRRPFSARNLAELALEGYFADHRDRHLSELTEFLRIPSVSTLPQHRPDIDAAARWVAEQLRQAGIEGVLMMETGGHPVVYGEWLKAPGAPTILVYGHYDVQPPDPLEKWVTPPFAPDFRENRIYARGVSDDKAPMFQALKAAEALMAVGGRLPLNVKFLFEGEEEIGSPSLPAFVAAHRELLAADLVVSADGAMWRASEPSITVAGRGMTALEVHLSTARIDLHSGRHGGAVPNALHAMAELVASLHDREGRVAVAGFYDRVRELTPEERAAITALPFDEDGYRQGLDLPALHGEPGYSTLERQWTRPTIDVVGMWGGFQGEGRKTVIPCEAHAKITCRLVANQRPDEIAALVAEHLERHTPQGARIKVRRFPGGSLPYEMPAALPALKVAEEVLTQVMGQPAVRVRMGGTLPAAEIFQSALGAYTLFYSFSTADEQYHAPNEFFRLERFDSGLRAWTGLWLRLGRI